jgi:hypothetical protein
MTTRAQVAEAPPHPLAGKRMTGAEMVVQVLVDEGVDIIFGYSGGAILPTYDAVFRYNDEHKAEDGTLPIPLIVRASWRPATPGPAAAWGSASSPPALAPPTPSRRSATPWPTRCR